MSSKTVSWTFVAAVALSAVLLLNYWGSYQPLSTLAYTGIVLAVCGLANLALPFRFLGITKRAIGAVVFAGGVGLAMIALLWPAPMVRVEHRRSLLDDAIPEYQFFERHSARVHARPEQVMQAARESTFDDMRSLATLLKIRRAALRIHQTGDSFRGKRILDAFSESGYRSAGNEHEIVMFGGANLRAQRPLEVRSLQEFADYREQGAIKMAFNISAEDGGDGWCTVRTETRVLALDDNTRRGMGRYWRLIVPGSGLLRRQWLDAIKTSAESVPRT